MAHELLHETPMGQYWHADISPFLASEVGEQLRGKVNLILTSPPYPLNNKKSYGNLEGDDYLAWLAGLAPQLAALLTPDGSIVVELGNAWLPGRPVQSLLHLEALLAFVKHEDAGLRLCQQFVCYNPARLPSPAAWVTVTRERLTDSFTHVWWMATSDHPKAGNRRVLRPYSESMRKLLRRQRYNAGRRPSEHQISENGFLTDHGGSIAQNFFELEPLDEQREVRLPNAFSFANTASTSRFLNTCRARGIEPHPARMPEGLAAFFVRFLTEPGDLVLDPFAGSNTTGYMAESLGRRWVAVDAKADYAQQSKIRFEEMVLEDSE